MAIDITREQLDAFLPDGKAAWLDAIIANEDWLCTQGLLNTAERWCHFMAQCAHESAGFTRFEENLNYRAARLVEVFPRHFPTLAAATPFERNPEKLANFVYADANRDAKDALGNVNPGDGWMFRGRGPIQATGRAMYVQLGLAETPDAANDPVTGIRVAAGIFVHVKGCLPLADKGDLKGVTKKINGGVNGLAERATWLRKARGIWGDATATSTGALVAKSQSTQVGTVVTVTGAAAAVAKTMTETPGDPLTTLKDAGATADAVKHSLDPMVGLVTLLMSNLWQIIAVGSLTTVGFMLYRRWKAHKDGAHV